MRQKSEVSGTRAAEHRATRREVLVVGGGEPLAGEVCAQLDGTAWRVVRAPSAEPAAHVGLATILALVVAPDVSAAERSVHELAATLDDAPIVVVVQGATPEQRRRVVAAGARACLDAVEVRRSPWRVVARQQLDLESLRRRLWGLTRELDARSALRSHSRKTLDETARALRASASGVLLSLQALRARSGADLSPVEGGVLDSLCHSVESMFELIDSLEGPTSHRDARPRLGTPGEV